MRATAAAGRALAEAAWALMEKTFGGCRRKGTGGECFLYSVSPRHRVFAVRSLSLIGEGGEPTVLPREISEWLKEHLSYAHVALFLGAGFSTDARNRAGEHLPDARRLAELLWNYLGYSGVYDNADLPTLFQAALNHRKGHVALQEFMQVHLLPTDVPD